MTHEHPATIIRREREYTYNARWSEYEREVQCTRCGRMVSFIKGGWADKHYGNMCSMRCANA